MSARRRRRARTGGSSNDGSSKNQNKGSGNNDRSGGGGRRRRRSRNRKGSNRRRRRRSGRSRAQEGAGFWGRQKKLPEARRDVRITDDPTAVVRSLGPPPLPGHEKISEHYFKAVYDRAVTTAGALAAAGGMIEPEQLTGGSAEDEE